MIAGVAHIGLYIKDVERSIAFYRDVLGFELIHRFTSLEGNLMAFMKSGNLIIELIQHVVWMDRKDGLFDHIAMAVILFSDKTLPFYQRGFAVTRAACFAPWRKTRLIQNLTRLRRYKKLREAFYQIPV